MRKKTEQNKLNLLPFEVVLTEDRLFNLLIRAFVSLFVGVVEAEILFACSLSDLSTIDKSKRAVDRSFIFFGASMFVLVMLLRCQKMI